ncbi:MAG: SHOCT domain-containing protein [Methanomassiliicoccales archaeon]|nr:SHOCT domain-containing protein [Methanomassiliicoccales archaeon]
MRVRLLRAFWINATMALTDTVGAKSALDALRPYFIHHGKYTASMIRSQQIKFSTPEDIYYGCARSNQMVNHTKVCGELREKGVLYKAMDCATKGASSVACICNCRLTIEPALEDLNSEYGILMNQSLSGGDLLCSWTIASKGLMHTTDLGDKIADLEPPPIDAELFEEFAPAVLGEYWAISTKSFIEVVGEDRTREILTERQREFGGESAVGIISLFGLEEGTKVSPGEAMGFMSEVFQMMGDGGSADLPLVEKEISECPFSGSPEEVCYQYEAFLNGLLSKIEPDCELKYDRMMTKGDKTCHWAIRKCLETKVKERPGDPLIILALRLARGEISDEEFEKKKALLKGAGF